MSDAGWILAVQLLLFGGVILTTRWSNLDHLSGRVIKQGYAPRVSGHMACG
ncbi:MAG: hypothetical protein VB144_14950 [Clostridia bacterium]|nr:hypothetical protein [Clostridia bacterium]